MTAPTVEEVGRIVSWADPVVRNLQITQCYHELAQVMATLTGSEANWCAFATWASKQAGYTIRGEDLARAVADELHGAADVETVLEAVRHAADRLGVRHDLESLRRTVLRAADPATMLRRAGDAVARGNLKVFEEIGREFARFLAVFAGDHAFDPAKTALFCTALRSGGPPDGQDLLRDAFTTYARARFEDDPRTRAELMYYANLLVGLHEQTRLQPEIEEAMEASLGDTEAARQRVLRSVLPGFWRCLRYRLSRLLRTRLPLDEAIDRLIETIRRHVRRVVTDTLLTIHLSEGRRLRLGRDLDAPFPPVLSEIASPQLRDILSRVDPTPDSTARSGAEDWADLPDRMHFITDFFRCYHAWEPLFDAPFNAAQVAQLKAGHRPDGAL